MAFEAQLYIRFHHVDFAQVVYFPKFFDYCHQVFEDFVQAEFGKSYRCLMEEEGVGFPMVHAEADFKKTFSFGDTARVLLEVISLGKTSLKCRYAFFHPGEESCAAVITLVGACVSMQGFRPTPIPERWRNMLGRHLQNPPNLL